MKRNKTKRNIKKTSVVKNQVRTEKRVRTHTIVGVKRVLGKNHIQRDKKRVAVYGPSPTHQHHDTHDSIRKRVRANAQIRHMRACSLMMASEKASAECVQILLASQPDSTTRLRRSGGSQSKPSTNPQHIGTHAHEPGAGAGTPFTCDSGGADEITLATFCTISSSCMKKKDKKRLPPI